MFSFEFTWSNLLKIHGIRVFWKLICSKPVDWQQGREHPVSLFFCKGSWLFADFNSTFIRFLGTAGIAFCPTFQTASVPTCVECLFLIGSERSDVDSNTVPSSKNWAWKWGKSKEFNIKQSWGFFLSNSLFCKVVVKAVTALHPCCREGTRDWAELCYTATSQSSWEPLENKEKLQPDQDYFNLFWRLIRLLFSSRKYRVQK